MDEAKFIFLKKNLLEQVEKLKNLGLKISYSYKTNNEVGNILQEISEIDFSIHTKEEIEMIKNKNKIWFFTQAESEEELKNLLIIGIKKFVVDNELDLQKILNTIKNSNERIDLSLRMKFQEHRIGTGKYFVYGIDSKKVNQIIKEEFENPLIENLGIHIHRKSQNTSEWEIQTELEDSITKENLKRIDFINFGGGLPTEYKNYTLKIIPYIFQKIKETKNFLENYNIKSYIEPGRFLASPCIKLQTQIIQIYEKNIILNTTIYNCALDTILTGTKMLVEQELKDEEEGDYYLIKGNSPTRDDIFRYKVKLKNPKVGDTITFLNAGAYNYTTDFFGYKKLKSEIGV
ncbi:MAG: decarboxylase [Nanoarchaeota archaeon]